MNETKLEASKVSDEFAKKNPILQEQFRSTKKWNDLMETFCLNMPLKRHWRNFRTYPDCFTASEAIEWLYRHLKSNQNFAHVSISRQNAIKVLQIFLKDKIIEDVRSLGSNSNNNNGGGSSNSNGDESTKEFHDDDRVYRFNAHNIYYLNRTSSSSNAATSTTASTTESFSTEKHPKSNGDKENNKPDQHLNTILNPTASSSSSSSSSIKASKHVVNSKCESSSTRVVESMRLNVTATLKKSNSSSSNKNTSDHSTVRLNEISISKQAEIWSRVTYKTLESILKKAVLSTACTVPIKRALESSTLPPATSTLKRPVAAAAAAAAATAGAAALANYAVNTTVDVKHLSVSKLLDKRAADLLTSGAFGAHVRHNCTHVNKHGVVINTDDDLPSWLVKAMTTLLLWDDENSSHAATQHANAPNEGDTVPLDDQFPKFQDVFDEVNNYFNELSEPLLTRDIGHLFMQILRLLVVPATSTTAPNTSRPDDPISKRCRVDHHHNKCTAVGAYPPMSDSEQSSNGNYFAAAAAAASAAASAADSNHLSNKLLSEKIFKIIELLREKKSDTTVSATASASSLPADGSVESERRRRQREYETVLNSINNLNVDAHSNSQSQKAQQQLQQSLQQKSKSSANFNVKSRIEESLIGNAYLPESLLLLHQKPIESAEQWKMASETNAAADDDEVFLHDQLISSISKLEHCCDECLSTFNQINEFIDVNSCEYQDYLNQLLLLDDAEEEGGELDDLPDDYDYFEECDDGGSGGGDMAARDDYSYARSLLSSNADLYGTIRFLPTQIMRHNYLNEMFLRDERAGVHVDESQRTKYYDEIAAMCASGAGGGGSAGGIGGGISSKAAAVNRSLMADRKLRRNNSFRVAIGDIHAERSQNSNANNQPASQQQRPIRANAFDFHFKMPNAAPILNGGGGNFGAKNGPIPKSLSLNFNQTFSNSSSSSTSGSCASETTTPTYTSSVIDQLRNTSGRKRKSPVSLCPSMSFVDHSSCSSMTRISKMSRASHVDAVPSGRVGYYKSSSINGLDSIQSSGHPPPPMPLTLPPTSMPAAAATGARPRPLLQQPQPDFSSLFLLNRLLPSLSLSSLQQPPPTTSGGVGSAGVNKPMHGASKYSTATVSSAAAAHCFDNFSSLQNLTHIPEVAPAAHNFSLFSKSSNLANDRGTLSSSASAHMDLQRFRSNTQAPTNATKPFRLTLSTEIDSEIFVYIIAAFRLCAFMLPPTNKRKLHLLLRFLNKLKHNKQTIKYLSPASTSKSPSIYDDLNFIDTSGHTNKSYDLTTSGDEPTALKLKFNASRVNAKRCSSGGGGGGVVSTSDADDGPNLIETLIVKSFIGAVVGVSSDVSVAAAASAAVVVTASKRNGPHGDEQHTSGVTELQLGLKLVQILINNYTEIMRIPEDLLANVKLKLNSSKPAVSSSSSPYDAEQLIRTATTTTAATATVMTVANNQSSSCQSKLTSGRFCSKISLQQYDKQKSELSKQQLTGLLHSILTDASMKEEEKLQRLRRFKEAHPLIYEEKYPTIKKALNILGLNAAANNAQFLNATAVASSANVGDSASNKRVYLSSKQTNATFNRTHVVSSQSSSSAAAAGTAAGAAVASSTNKINSTSSMIQSTTINFPKFFKKKKENC